MPQAFTSGATGGGGGGGTVTSVSSADTSIAVTNPTTTPALQLARLNVLATNEPPIAAVPLNGQKITGLANGTVASDAAAFGQIPAALPPSGAAGGDLTGTYPNPTLAAAGGGAAGPTGSTSVVPVVTVDAKGRVTALASASPTVATLTAPAADWSNNSHKITSVADGTLAQDAAAFGQLPTSVFSSGSSTSGTAGTVVADLAAAANFQLVGLSIAVAQASATASGFTLTVTYSDATTTTLTSSLAQFQGYAGNQGGIIQVNANAGLTTFSAKAITEVKVATAGTGTGLRAATIAALQIPL